ncbi:MAG TPA: ComEC/Rec2 family competence protein [Syntrophales bacterium]|nr:ComEC/Rec2 family competence protein [Syntrophales bacterium]
MVYNGPMKRPLLPLLAFQIAGILIGSSFRLPEAILPAALAALLLFLLAFRIRRRSRAAAWTACAGISIAAAILIQSSLYGAPPPDSVSRFAGRDPVTVQGTVCEHPRRSPDRTDLIVCASQTFRGGDRETATGKVLLSLKDPAPRDFVYGDHLRFRARLRVPSSFHNPGGFDAERYLRLQGIRLRASLADPSAVILIRKDTGNPARAGLESFREGLKRFIYGHAPSPEREVIQSVILGDAKEIPESVTEDFNRTGTSHIIAISGFNIGIIAAFFFFLFRAALSRSETILLASPVRPLAMALAVIPVLAFTLVAGAGISVLRAAIMVLALMAALLIGRERDLYNVLALAAIAILMVSPGSLFDVSFQLSFAAVASLLFVAPRLALWIPRPDPEQGSPTVRLFRKALHQAALFVVVTLAATLGTLPLVAFHFNRVSLIALAANLLVVPILGLLAIPLCTLLILAWLFSDGLASILTSAAALLVKVSLDLLSSLASLPWASLYVPTPGVLQVAVFYILLVASVLCIEVLAERRERGSRITTGDPEDRRNRPFAPFAWIAGACILFLVLQSTYLLLADRRPETLRVTAVDVGQGSATLLRLPRGSRVLVDGGGVHGISRFDIGEQVLAPFLWHERILRIDTVVLSHPHPDHMGGLPFVLKNFQVGEFWTTAETASSPEFLPIRRILEDRGIVLRTVGTASEAAVLDGVRIEFLHPTPRIPKPAAGESDYGDANDSSLVLRLTMGEVGVLIPGDISGNVEEELVRSGRDLSASILLAPHHGARSSGMLPFLRHVRPRLVIVSSGRDNLFGHPHPDLLARCRAVGAAVYRTDRSGAVTVTTDGRKIEVDTFLKNGPRTGGTS